MAKGSKSRPRARSLNPIRTLATAAPSQTVRRALSFRPMLDLRLLEDRRTWHPEGNVRKPLAFPQIAATVFDNPNNRRNPPNLHKTFPAGTLTFQAPDKVVMCVRRKRRKEVIFAKNKAGKRGQRKPRRNFWSKISCKR